MFHLRKIFLQFIRLRSFLISLRCAQTTPIASAIGRPGGIAIVMRSRAFITCAEGSKQPKCKTTMEKINPNTAQITITRITKAPSRWNLMSCGFG